MFDCWSPTEAALPGAASCDDRLVATTVSSPVNRRIYSNEQSRSKNHMQQQEKKRKRSHPNIRMQQQLNSRRRLRDMSSEYLLISSFITTTICIAAMVASAQLLERQPPQMYRLGLDYRQQAAPSPNGRPSSHASSGGPHANHIPQNWARAMSSSSGSEFPPATTATLMRDSTLATATSATIDQAQTSRRAQARQQQPPKTVRHILTTPPASLQSNLSTDPSEDICADRLCQGLPQGCLAGGSIDGGNIRTGVSRSSQCSVLVTSKRFIDPNRPVARDILFELIALPVPNQGNYAAVGFSDTGRMQGLVSECLQYRDAKTQVQIIKLKHSFNMPAMYSNVPVKILSGIKNLGVSFEDGHYQCRWIVESAVEFSYEALNGSVITRREDLGYRNYHILLATGEYNQISDIKSIHSDRVVSMAPISLAQTGHIRSLGAHILIRIHGSLMIAIWVGLVTLSVIMARYYKNEWASSKINDLAIWFVVHRALMLTAWFGSIIAVIFAYMYTETYHPAVHQLSGTMCLILITIQVIGGLFRPSQESSKRAYFNWTHFMCGNLSYLLAMVCLVTAAFLRPANLPALYIWVVVAFVATYALAHAMMTAHQYVMHRSSKISITPMSDLNSNAFVGGDSYLEDTNSPFRQFMLGILVTVVVIFIVILISLVNIESGSTRTA